jgi:sulfatase maturation enzyme AslB (radical SAM superfamily)
VKYAKLLSARGFPIFVSVVEELKPTGLYPIPKALRGNFARRRYPVNYTTNDKEMFRSFAAEARIRYSDMIENIRDTFSIQILADENYLRGFPLFVGENCSAGVESVTMQGNGDVYRCNKHTVFGTSQLMGNLLDGSSRRARKQKFAYQNIVRTIA